MEMSIQNNKFNVHPPPPYPLTLNPTIHTYMFHFLRLQTW